ncbi:MAG: electron transfer flavoprotein subunit beta/FixA family protein [Deltaproteobacteria bacterium]|jgi:electron transfer flavoprotein beta subunit|nr:electron transfer flavoprotein subunit beta/FixA family protein [Deltaproteobacteria bacterium]
MNIYVCVKHVPDTAVNIKISGDNTIESKGCKFVVNPYDEYAIEEAITTVKNAGQGEVIVVTVGNSDAIASIRNALAIGADRGILVKNDHYFLDSASTALALKKAIENDGQPDLILMGKTSVDSEGLQTQYRLASAFNMPIANEVSKMEMGEGKVIVEREIEGGTRQVIELKTPCVIGATKGLNEPRYPKLPDILKAKKKAVQELDISELGVTQDGPVAELIKLEAVAERSAAKIIDGSTQEMAQKLVKILKEEEKVI